MRIRSMNSTKPQCPLAPGTTFRPAHDWNTIPDTTPLMYSTQTDIHSRSSIKANDGTARQVSEAREEAVGRGCDHGPSVALANPPARRNQTDGSASLRLTERSDGTHN